MNTIDKRKIVRCVAIVHKRTPSMAEVRYEDGGTGLIPAAHVPRELRVEMHKRNQAWSHASTNRGDA